MDTVFKVIGYEIKTPDGQFLNSCIFWIYAKEESEAIKKAKTYKVKKANFEVLEVIEKKDVTS